MKTVVGAHLRGAPLKRDFIIKNLRILELFLTKTIKTPDGVLPPSGMQHVFVMPYASKLATPCQIRLAASTMPTNPHGQKQRLRLKTHPCVIFEHGTHSKFAEDCGGAAQNS